MSEIVYILEEIVAEESQIIGVYGSKDAAKAEGEGLWGEEPQKWQDNGVITWIPRAAETLSITAFKVQN